MQPDEEFEPGQYVHLVVGNHGRLLDPRRTPVQLMDLDLESGMFTVQIKAFEDKGALWDIDFEEVHKFQFMKGEARATSGVLKKMERAVQTFDCPLHIEADIRKGEETLAVLKKYRQEVAHWLEEHSSFFAEGRQLPDPEQRKGDPFLWNDLQTFMSEKGLSEIESSFSRQFVSNPHSGELVKGHRIVMAELGLVSFVGKVVRKKGLFAGGWSKANRSKHILYRLAFTQSFLKCLGVEQLHLYRGMSSEAEINPPINNTFVSATLSAAVAQSHFEAGKGKRFTALQRQWVPLGRVFMTFYETEEMNDLYQEAEAVLLFDSHNPIF